MHAPAQATYPEKAVRIVIGFPPGTTADVIARVLAPKMAETLGQQVVIENKPGAGSSIAAENVARAPADGHTLLMSTIANTINPGLYKLSFDFSRDLAPVIRIAELPGLLVAHPGAAQTLQQLVGAARAKPGGITFGSSGNGTVTHLYGELFGLATGGKLTHVPYKGSSQAVTDLLAGRIALLFSPASTVIPHVKAGTLRALGAIGPQRSAALPEVPTFAEAGVAGFETSLWFGLMAPAGTAPAIIERLDQAVQRAMGMADVKSQFAGQGIEAALLRGEPFGAFIRQDTEKWARVVKAAGVKAD
jgi:tripartite-type tricarboxylate transporter receptor subunit TctC